MFLWILAFPFYIAKRPLFKLAKDNPVEVKSGFSLIAIFGIIFLILVIIGVIIGGTIAYMEDKQDIKSEEVSKSDRTEILDGMCGSTSHMAKGKIGEDLTKSQIPYACNKAMITFFSDTKDHVMVTFVNKGTETSVPLSFAGKIDEDKLLVHLDKVYIKPGVPLPVSESLCKIFYKDQAVSEIFCGAKVDENGYRKMAVITFKTN